MFCHLAAFAGFVVPFGSLLGPVIVWLATRRESPFVDAHGRESVNLQSTILVTQAVVLLAAVLIAFDLFVAILDGGGRSSSVDLDRFIQRIVIPGVGMLCLSALSVVGAGVGAIRARGGRAIRFPLTIPFVGRSDPEFALSSRERDSEELR